MKLSKIILLPLCLFLLTTFSTLSFANVKNHDGEIISFMQAINNNEINAAKVAQGKKVDAAVMEYANTMVEQHTANLQTLNELSTSIDIAPEETKAVKQFKKKGENELTTLNKLNDAKFQNAYIKAMIKGHTEANKKLARFIKEAQNAKLKQYLMDTKPVVMQHLSEAKKLK